MSDYYSLLGVPKSASFEEIKSAYKRKVIEWHPDRNKSSEAPEMIKKINRAYEVLSDPQKRTIYDQIGHHAYEQRGSAGAGAQGYPGGEYQYGGFTVDFGAQGFENISDIFETFFGGNPFGSGSSRTRQRRQVYEMLLTFDEAVRGVTKTTVIQGKQKEIKIPAGVDTGNRVRFEDFDVIIEVKAHPYFRREGQDIFYEKELPFTTAVLGGVVDVPLIEGSIQLKVRPGTQTGTTVRLTGKGIPYPNSHRFGDLYVVFKVQVPTKVSPKAKKLLEELSHELQ
jgi:DnaJ-class molecular chaperone